MSFPLLKQPLTELHNRENAVLLHVSVWQNGKDVICLLTGTGPQIFSKITSEPDNFQTDMSMHV